ncbi:MAG: selenium-dependent molybdenum cofactor biosynthesis protein YqeB [Anaerolineales bacterium]|nr:selenium-dependent molybdenum cofactor biosynthesis protein YqeB [Anaerolineales bacterium]
MTQAPVPAKILVRGSNDVASAVAHRLFQMGYPVILHEIPKPSATRRKMSFTDAVFDGMATLNGVQARRVTGFLELEKALTAHEFIPVQVWNFSRLIGKLRPQILVDARMRKHKKPARQIHLAPLTIGLGPNFIAGVTVRVAIETARGEGLGRVILSGKTAPLQGEPMSIKGHARDRFVYAPCAGKFTTTFQIGDMVAEGQEIAHINEIPLTAPVSGKIRGLTHDGAPVVVRTKVIEIDPRGDNGKVSGIGERPSCIADGVLQVVNDWQAGQPSRAGTGRRK